MRPEGTIYHQKKDSSSGELRIALTRMMKALYRFMQGAGVGIITLGVLFLLINFGPVAWGEIRYQLGRKPVAPELLTDATDIIEVQSIAASYGVGSHFSVVIPKIDATSNVIPNVNPADEGEYSEALMQGVAHARGTYFPGQGRNIFLFSHSTGSSFDVTRFNAVFYLLRKLEKGDEIIVFFADKQYVYTVREIVYAAASDTHWLTDTRSSETLILQTCDPPGTSIRRLIVVAEPTSQVALR